MLRIQGLPHSQFTIFGSIKFSIEKQTRDHPPVAKARNPHHFWLSPPFYFSIFLTVCLECCFWLSFLSTWLPHGQGPHHLSPLWEDCLASCPAPHFHFTHQVDLPAKHIWSGHFRAKKSWVVPHHLQTASLNLTGHQSHLGKTPNLYILGSHASDF